MFGLHWSSASSNGLASEKRPCCSNGWFWAMAGAYAANGSQATSIRPVANTTATWPPFEP